MVGLGGRAAVGRVRYLQSNTQRYISRSSRVGGLEPPQKLQSTTSKTTHDELRSGETCERSIGMLSIVAPLRGDSLLRTLSVRNGRLACHLLG